MKRKSFHLFNWCTILHYARDNEWGHGKSEKSNIFVIIFALNSFYIIVFEYSRYDRVCQKDSEYFTATICRSVIAVDWGRCSLSICYRRGSLSVWGSWRRSRIRWLWDRWRRSPARPGDHPGWSWPAWRPPGWTQPSSACIQQETINHCLKGTVSWNGYFFEGLLFLYRITGGFL